MLRKIFWLFVFGWCCTCFFVRCYMNLVGLETGRTLEEGKAEITGSVSRISHSPIFPEYVFIPPDEEMDPVDFENGGALNAQIQYGARDRFDLGLGVSTVGQLGLSTKYGLLKKRPAAGLRIWFWTYPWRALP